MKRIISGFDNTILTLFVGIGLGGFISFFFLQETTIVEHSAAVQAGENRIDLVDNSPEEVDNSADLADNSPEHVDNGAQSVKNTAGKQKEVKIEVTGIDSIDLEFQSTLDDYATFNELFIPLGSTGFDLPLTPAGLETIASIRSSGTPTTLIKNERNTEALCAGYLYELTDHLWGPLGPMSVGMLHPQTKTASDAWELPYSYRWKGGTIMYDIGDHHGPDLKKNPSSFPSIIHSNELLKLFTAAFSRDNLFGDIGFLYSQSNYLRMIGAYGNYNSHIAKNMGLRTFSVMVQTFEDNNITTYDMLKETLGCDEAMRPAMQKVFSRYAIEINGFPARWLSSGELRIKKSEHRELYRLQPLDRVTYTDVVIAHFREGEKVDSLFQFSCQGKFYPINVIAINPKFIEKK